MIIPAQYIIQRCMKQKLIEPWSVRTKVHGMTYGVGPAGYDVRIDQEVILAPYDFVLASTMEKFNMPTDLLGQVCDKSTWARRGLCVQNTIIEPGWSGYLTLELTNHTSDWISIHQGMPICQIIFFCLMKPTMSPYDGKYQNQEARPVEAILERSDV